MYYYNNELPPQQGWICPKCGRVNAPWMPTCGCVSSQTKATYNPTSVNNIWEKPKVVGYATDSVSGEILGMTLDTDCAWGKTE